MFHFPRVSRYNANKVQTPLYWISFNKSPTQLMHTEKKRRKKVQAVIYQAVYWVNSDAVQWDKQKEEKRSECSAHMEKKLNNKRSNKYSNISFFIAINFAIVRIVWRDSMSGECHAVGHDWIVGHDNCCNFNRLTILNLSIVLFL